MRTIFYIKLNIGTKTTIQNLTNDKNVLIIDKKLSHMNYVEIPVPIGAKFISDIPNFSFPDKSCIIDKTICGCGFTEWCLNNDIPVILCSPRKILLSNKTEQHNLPGSKKKPVYYFQNEKEVTLNFDSEFSSNSNYVSESTPKCYNNLFSNMKLSKSVSTDGALYIKNLKDDLLQWIFTGYQTNPNFVPKILVTYDSFKYVVEALSTNLSQFVIVVDEFQSIFTDSTFKPDVELSLVDLLSTLPNKSIFISATPMMERYLDSLPYFSGMTVYKLIWHESAIEKVNISKRYTNSIRSEICQIIDNYKKGIYPTKTTLDGVEHHSKEAVFFINSVTIIIDVLKKTGLKPEEVNIICADTETNKKKLANIGHSVGKVPINVADNKMFTFCTRTTYIGADFYSTNAMTFVFSDLNIQSLTVDISLDLLQIVGRQRLSVNVFRNEIIFYYHKRNDNFFASEADFQAYIAMKDDRTKKFIEFAKTVDLEVLTAMVKKHNKIERYRGDYVGYSKILNCPVENTLVKLSELRAWEITRPDYLDSILIKKSNIDPTPVGFNVGAVNVNMNPDLMIIEGFREKFTSTGNFSERMKMFHEFVLSNPGLYQNYNSYFVSFIPIEYRNYVNKVGFDRMQKLGYNRKNIDSSINLQRLTSSNQFLAELRKNFEIGKSYSLSTIKEVLRGIYQSLGETSTPKATDLLNYVTIQEVTWVDPQNKKRIHGYKILNYK